MANEKITTKSTGRFENIEVFVPGSSYSLNYLLLQQNATWAVYRLNSDYSEMTTVGNWYEHFDAVTGAICDMQRHVRENKEKDLAEIQNLLEPVSEGVESLEPGDIPKDWPVRPVADTEVYKEIINPDADFMTCGQCGLTWDDNIVTGMTPVPSGRCPFEYWHRNAS